MAKPWFGVNRFWGWYPVTWLGYATVFLMFSAIIVAMFFSSYYSHSIIETLITALPFVSLSISVVMLLALSKGEQPKLGKTHHNSKSYSPDSPTAYLFLTIISIPVALLYFINQNYLGTLVFLLVTFLLYKVYLKLKLFQKG